MNTVETDVKIVDGQKLLALVDLDAGKLFCSSEGSMLTEPETEYVVRCIKHIFNQHLVLQVYAFIVAELNFFVLINILNIIV